MHLEKKQGSTAKFAISVVIARTQESPPLAKGCTRVAAASVAQSWAAAKRGAKKVVGVRMDAHASAAQHVAPVWSEPVWSVPQWSAPPSLSESSWCWEQPSTSGLPL